jgi:diacylglycerol kinase family enzyme
VTIEKGQEWGTRGRLPDEGVCVRTDAEARRIVEEARRAGRPPPPLGLLGGDLCRTLGGLGDEARLRSDDAVRFQIDLGAVLVDGRLHWFLAHLVAMRSWWRGPVVFGMNAQWIDGWNAGPRAHPSDGLLDVYELRLPLADRLRARRRLRTGAHVPHPAIRLRRTAAVQLTLDPPLPVSLDGEPVGTGRSLSLRLEPDALTVVV